MAQLTFTFERPFPLLSPDEIYQSASQTLFTVLKEDRRIERKPAGIHGRVLGEYHSMWANTAPEGGVTVLGMENDGAFSGCIMLSQNELNDREKAGHIYCPDARVESKRIAVINEQGHEDYVLIFRTYYREDKVVCDHLLKFATFLAMRLAGLEIQSINSPLTRFMNSKSIKAKST